MPGLNPDPFRLTQAIRVVAGPTRQEGEISKNLVSSIARAASTNGISKKEYMQILKEVRDNGVTQTERGFFANVLSRSNQGSSHLMKDLGAFLEQSTKPDSDQEPFVFELQDFDENQDHMVNQADGEAAQIYQAPASLELEPLPMSEPFDSVAYGMPDHSTDYEQLEFTLEGGDRLSLSQYDQDTQNNPLAIEISPEAQQSLKEATLDPALDYETRELMDFDEDNQISRAELMDIADTNGDGLINSKHQDMYLGPSRVRPLSVSPEQPIAEDEREPFNQAVRGYSIRMADTRHIPQLQPVSTQFIEPEQATRQLLEKRNLHTIDGLKKILDQKEFDPQIRAQKLDHALENLNPMRKLRTLESLQFDSVKLRIIQVLDQGDQSLSRQAESSQHQAAPCQAEHYYVQRLLQSLCQSNQPTGLQNFFQGLDAHTQAILSSALASMPVEQQKKLQPWLAQ